MERYFIHLAYKGTNYHGWQSQPNAISIQDTLQQAMKMVLKEDIGLIGCGRTDSGVHARNFYAHFDSESMGKHENSNLVYKLNRILPTDILIYSIFKVQNAAHCRFDAISRTYKYYITTSKEVFMNDYAWQQFIKLDLDLMNKASLTLLEYIDFTSFSKLHTDVKTNRCKIQEAYWKKDGNLLVFKIRADRFLRNMVRSIVGTLIEVGKVKMSIDDFRKVIEAKDRREAGISVPAKGLFLENVEYPYGIQLNTLDC